MFYWVIYDITENNKRTKIASKCLDYGLYRFQKSSFLGNLTRNKIEMLAIEIKDILNGSDDCIFILPMCRPCFQRKIIQGKFNEELIKKKDFLIINGE